MSRAALRSTIRMAMVMSDADEGVGEREPGQYAEGADDDGQ